MKTLLDDVITVWKRHHFSSHGRYAPCTSICKDGDFQLTREAVLRRRDPTASSLECSVQTCCYSRRLPRRGLRRRFVLDCQWHESESCKNLMAFDSRASYSGRTWWSADGSLWRADGSRGILTSPSARGPICRTPVASYNVRTI